MSHGADTRDAGRLWLGFPARHYDIRLFTRKMVRGRCHNQQLLNSDQCAPHHSWREAPPLLGAQRRGLASSRNRHDAADRVVKAANDGSWDTRHQISMSQNMLSMRHLQDRGQSSVWVTGKESGCVQAPRVETTQRPAPQPLEPLELSHCRQLAGASWLRWSFPEECCASS